MIGRSLQLAGDVIERGGQAAADGRQSADRRDGNQGANQAVLDRGGAVLVLQKPKQDAYMVMFSGGR